MKRQSCYRLRYGGLLIALVSLVGFLIPSYDMGGDSFYIEGLAKGLFSDYSVQRPTYNFGVHLFPVIQQLIEWFPTVPWSTRIGQFVFFATLVLMVRIGAHYRASLISLLATYCLLLQYWVHLSTPQVAFWSALIGAYAVVTATLPPLVRLSGFLLFLLSITIRDISALVALSILGGYLLFIIPFNRVFQFIPLYSALMGCILIIAFSANISLNPLNHRIDNLLMLCNDWMVCNPDLLTGNDKYLYDTYFNAWFIPEGSQKVLKEMETVVANTKPSFWNLFSKNKFEANYLMISYHHWTIPLIFILFIFLLMEIFWTKQYWIGKLGIILLVFAINCLRFFPYWTIDTLGGILILLFITDRSKLMKTKRLQYVAMVALLAGLIYSYQGSLGQYQYQKSAEAALPKPTEKITVFGSMMYMWALTNMVPAGNRPAMFQPGAQTKYYGLVDVGTNSEGLHKEVALAGGFEQWLFAKTRGKYVFLSDTSSIDLYLGYVKYRNPATTLKFIRGQKIIDYKVFETSTPIYKYTLEWE